MILHSSHHGQRIREVEGRAGPEGAGVYCRATNDEKRQSVDGEQAIGELGFAEL